MSKANSIRKKAKAEKVARTQKKNVFNAGLRPAADFLPNVRGFRYERGVIVRRNENYFDPFDEVGNSK